MIYFYEFLMQDKQKKKKAEMEKTHHVSAANSFHTGHNLSLTKSYTQPRNLHLFIFINGLLQS